MLSRARWRSGRPKRESNWQGFLDVPSVIRRWRTTGSHLQLIRGRHGSCASLALPKLSSLTPRSNPFAFETYVSTSVLFQRGRGAKMILGMHWTSQKMKKHASFIPLMSHCWCNMQAISVLEKCAGLYESNAPSSLLIKCLSCRPYAILTAVNNVVCSVCLDWCITLAQPV